MTDNKERSQACPFCGGTENLLSSNGVASHYVFCNSYDCGAEGPVRETEDGAISAWNARSALAASQEKAEPVALRKTFEEWLGEVVADGGCTVEALLVGDTDPIRCARSAWDACVASLSTAPQPSAEAVRDALEEAATIIDDAAKAASKEGDTKRKREYEFRAAQIRALKSAPSQPAEQPSASPAVLTDEQLQAIERVEYFLKAWEWNGVGQSVAQVSDSPDSYVGLILSDLRTTLALARAQGEQAAPEGEEIALNIIRRWPEGFQERLEHVWKDLIGFIPTYKLYDLQRVLAEFGFTMKVYDAVKVYPATPCAQEGA